MKLLIKYAIYLFPALFILSCIKENRDGCPVEPVSGGAIALFPDWSGRGDGLDIPAYFNAYLASEQASETYLFPRLTLENNLITGIKPLTYTLYTYNDAENITVSANIVTVAAQQARAEGTVLEQPGYLFTSVDRVTVPLNDTLPVYPQMVQQVRRLTITLDVRSSVPIVFSRFTGILHGTAGSLDLSSGQTGDPSSVNMLFIQAGTEVSVTVYLLGIVTSVDQSITLNFTYNNGIQDSLTLNLSPRLQNFNIDKRIPMILRAVLNLDQEAAVTASITDWEDHTEYIRPV